MVKRAQLFRKLIVPFVLVTVLCVYGPAAPARSQSRDPPSGASCRTLDSRDAPATLFSSGDRIVVTGESFPVSAVVTVEFVQGSTTELARMNADATRRFSTRSQATRIPSSAELGSATVRASGGGSSATCAIQVLSSATLPSSGTQNTGALGLWGFALFVFGSLLTVISLRKWRASRLAAAVAGGSSRSGSVLVDTARWDAIAYIEDDPMEEPIADGCLQEPIDQDEPDPADEDDLEDVDEEIEEPVDEVARETAEGAGGMSSTVARLMAETKGWKER